MSKDELNNLIFATIISADYPNFTEEEKQSMISHYKKEENKSDWEYILGGINDKDKRNKYIDLLTTKED